MLPPPGLEGPLAGQGAPALGGAERWLQEVGCSGKSFEEKAAELWLSAESRLQQLEEEHSRTTSRLEEEIKRCHEKHESLQREKSLLESNVAQLRERMLLAEAALGLGRGGQEGAAAQAPGLPLVRVVPPAEQGLPLVRVVPPAEQRNEGEYPTLPEFPEFKEERKEQDGPSGPPGLSPPSSPRATTGTLRLEPLLQSPKPKTSALEKAESGRPEFASPVKTTSTLQPPLTPPRTPQTLSNHAARGTLTPMKSPATAAVPSSPFVHCESGGCAFGFMLRVADGCELGLDTEVTEDGRALSVKGVKPGSAVDSWNRQCVGGPSAGKTVMVGDRITAVNGVHEPLAMLAALQDKRVLALAVLRGEDDCDIPGQWTAHFAQREEGGAKGALAAEQLRCKTAPATWTAPPLRSPSGLRADAFEFVPISGQFPPPFTMPPPVVAGPFSGE